MDKFLIMSLSIIIQFLILSLNFNPYDNKHLKLCFPSCQLFRKVLFGQWASCWATASSSSIPSLHKWGSDPRESSQFAQVLSAADSLSPAPAPLLPGVLIPQQPRVFSTPCSLPMVICHFMANMLILGWRHHQEQLRQNLGFHIPLRTDA